MAKDEMVSDQGQARWLTQWVVGALFAAVMTLGGWAYSSEAQQRIDTQKKVDSHSERIAILETMAKQQLETNKQLLEETKRSAEAFRAWLEYDRRRNNRAPR